ncbi:DUF29 domain-containing protein [Myxosarcina sp. GI1(2024)]
MSTEISESLPNKNNLYERDYYLWLENTIQLLQAGKFKELDIPNLIEEIKDMSRSEKRAIVSNLRIVLIHLLKYEYQPEKRTNSWRFTIREHRLRLHDLFEDNSSLKNYFVEQFSKSYQNARKLAADETGLPLETFPINAPFSKEQTLDLEYLPE